MLTQIRLMVGKMTVLGRGGLDLNWSLLQHFVSPRAFSIESFDILTSIAVVGRVAEGL